MNESCSYEIEVSVTLITNVAAFFGLNCVIEVLSLIINAVFLATLIKTRSLHTPSNVLLGALCIVDLLICIVLQPTLLYKIVLFLSGVHEVENAHWFWLACDIIFGFSFTIITLVSLDRYAAICHPFWYQRRVTCKAHITAAMSGCILFALFFSIEFIISDKISSPLVVIGTTIASRLTHYLIPGTIFIYCYTRIYLVIRRQRKIKVTIGQITDSERTEITRKKTERGKTCTVLLIVICFIITYAPSTIWMAVEAGSGNCEPSNTAQIVSMWTTFPLLLSTLINPILYHVRNKDVRLAVTRIIKCE